MDSCYSGDHITRDYIHRDIKSYNIEDSQQKYRLGTVKHSLPGVLRGDIKKF